MSAANPTGSKRVPPASDHLHPSVLMFYTSDTGACQSGAGFRSPLTRQERSFNLINPGWKTAKGQACNPIHSHLITPLPLRELPRARLLDFDFDSSTSAPPLHPVGTAHVMGWGRDRGSWARGRLSRAGAPASLFISSPIPQTDPLPVCSP